MSDWVEFFKKTAINRNIFNHCLGKRRLIELIIENTPKEGRILEAGCGTALLSLILADFGFNVTALDYTDDILKYAESRIRLNTVQLKFVKGDIMKLSSTFEKKYFDVICHSGVMEHFSDEDIVKSLTEQRIVSKKTIFNIPNNRVNLSTGHFGDERFLSNRKWKRLLMEAGFRNITVFGGYDLPKYTLVLPGVLLHKKGSFWWKWFSKHSIFLCE